MHGLDDRKMHGLDDRKMLNALLKRPMSSDSPPASTAGAPYSATAAAKASAPSSAATWKVWQRARVCIDSAAPSPSAGMQYAAVPPVAPLLPYGHSFQPWYFFPSPSLPQRWQRGRARLFSLSNPTGGVGLEPAQKPSKPFPRLFRGKEQYFEAAKDSEKLSKIVDVLKNEFGSAGLDLASFEFDDLIKGVIPKVSELLYDTFAYIVKTDSVAEHFLLGTDSVSDRDGRRALLDLIKGRVPLGVRQTLQEEHSQLRYPARVDPRPILAKEHKLVRDNQAEDWTPTEMSRKYKMFERLDPDFYAAVRVRHPMPNDLRPVPLSTLANLITHIFVSWEQQQAELGGAAGLGVAGAVYSGVDERIVEVLGQLTSRLEKIEAAIEFQKVGGAENKLALPLCHRRSREGEGKKYHGWKECPYGGKGAASGTAAYCMPADGEGAAEAMHTLALYQIFQVVADDGAEAFAAAVAEYGAPAVLAGGESDDIDE
ncbi:hypothetical protein CYMTET_50332 [Cymbomonas tetramitiformis]|uniref:Uncharacterized protein n=1 Tax=Cymbomonas tetramitiformis TaxID=36881 RepID=A0AAE0BPH2_9CHLO|nr:hypothetical protein CYMTET_50332 [Cymbomonas tetramitiformis]